MRILDRYVARQLLPVWLWCLVVFLFLSCLIDLFEHLDEILRYHIPAATVWQYYLNFAPLVFVRASPLALLLGGSFVAGRLSRYQELLAMNASGISLLRAGVPFLFVGWLASLAVFAVNDLVVPQTSAAYERLRQEAFRGRQPEEIVDNVAIMDAFNRLYHAQHLDVENRELRGLTILEHDRENRPIKNVYAARALWTRHGWVLLHGTIYRVGPRGTLLGEPESFVERVYHYPVTAASFSEPETRPETMRYSQLRLMILRLRQMGMKNVRRYQVELAAKLTLPLMNLVVALIAFTGSTQPQLRGTLKGLGLSLAWGLAYYFGVGFGEGIAKKGLLGLPAVIAAWAPHVLAVGWCWRVAGRRR